MTPWRPINQVNHLLGTPVEQMRMTIVCQPADEERVQAMVDAHPLSRALTVETSPFIPAGQMVIINRGELDAAMQQRVDEVIRPWQPPATPPSGDIRADLDAVRRWLEEGGG